MAGNVTRIVLTYTFEVVGAPNDQVAQVLVMSGVSMSEQCRSTLLKVATVQAIPVTPEMLAAEEAERRKASRSLRVES
jgi:hypothetical protein